MVVFSTGTTCTLTVGSASRFSLEQTETERKVATTIRVTAMRAPRERRKSVRSREDFMGKLRLIWLKSPRQSLQVGDCNPGTRLSLVISIACLSKSILGIHDFKYRRFSGLVAQVGEAEAFCRHLRGTGQRFHF